MNADETTYASGPTVAVPRSDLVSYCDAPASLKRHGPVRHAILRKEVREI
jgi:hypothetical protein